MTADVVIRPDYTSSHIWRKTKEENWKKYFQDIWVAVLKICYLQIYNFLRVSTSENQHKYMLIKWPNEVRQLQIIT